jgi:hypothetical protein
MKAVSLPKKPPYLPLNFELYDRSLRQRLIGYQIPAPGHNTLHRPWLWKDERGSHLNISRAHVIADRETNSLSISIDARQVGLRHIPFSPNECTARSDQPPVRCGFENNSGRSAL